MFNIYYISNCGIPLSHLKTENKKEIPLILKTEISKLESDSNNYILITPNELPTYEVKGIGENEILHAMDF